jgi:hypothetical protein
MKRLFVLALATAVGVGTLATAQAAQQSQAQKWTLCHRTVAKKRPYVKVTVSTRAALNGHRRHAQDIIPAPAGPCPTTVLSPTQGGVALTATLTGAAEVPGPGDPNGTGTATIRLRAGQGQVCFTLSVANITLPTIGAHIHIGTAAQAGDVVVALKPPNGSGTSSGCVAANRTLVAAILANPAGYYVNVHTTDFPNGAIRGQLTA